MLDWNSAALCGNGIRLLNHVSGVGYRALQIVHTRKRLSQRLEPLVPVDQNQVVERVDDFADPLFILSLFSAIHQDVSNAGHDHGLAGPVAGACQ